MANEYMAHEVKDGRGYRETHRDTDALEIYKSLAEDLTRKYVLGATGYTVTQKNNYDGTRTIKIAGGNGYRRVYRVKF